MLNNQPVLLQTVPGPVQQVQNNTIDNEHVQITYSSNSLTAFIKSPSVRIEVDSWYGYQLFVPSSICEFSYGHLGSCDGIPDNDVAIAGLDDCKLTKIALSKYVFVLLQFLLCVLSSINLFEGIIAALKAVLCAISINLLLRSNN